MSAIEFSIIEKYFQISSDCYPQDIVMGSGDDAAVFAANRQNKTLTSDFLHTKLNSSKTQSADNSLHQLSAFLNKTSDIEHRYLLLNLSLTETNEQWLAYFSESIHQILADNNISLIGGDTTSGGDFIVYQLLMIQ